MQETPADNLPSGRQPAVFSSPFKRLASIIVVGAAAGAGWAFSHYVGCDSGCAIQGNPPVMATIGGLLGAQVFLIKRDA